MGAGSGLALLLLLADCRNHQSPSALNGTGVSHEVGWAASRDLLPRQQLPLILKRLSDVQKRCVSSDHPLPCYLLKHKLRI